MDGVKKILVATDYAERTRRAESRAAMLSIELKAQTLEMMAVQNIRMGLGTPAAVTGDAVIGKDALVSLFESAELSPTIVQAADGPSCIRSVALGKPAAAIMARAEQLGADLVVVAARGKNFFADLFVRQSNDALVRSSTRPILLVETEPQSAYKKVLVAVDLSAESREAARIALLIAPSAQITFLHAYQVPDEGMMREVGVSSEIIQSYRVRAGATARTQLNQFIEELGAKPQLTSSAIHRGHPVAAIADFAQRIGADLIAMGKHGKSQFAEFLLGSVTQRVINKTSCDLLIAPTPVGDDWRQRPDA